MLQLKQYKPALDDLNNAAVLDPENGDAIYFREWLRKSLGNCLKQLKTTSRARDLKFTPLATEIDMSDYMNRLSRKIKINWHPPKATTSKHAVTVFSVLRDGKVTHLKIEKTSGIAAARCSRYFGG